MKIRIQNKSSCLTLYRDQDREKEILARFAPGEMTAGKREGNDLDQDQTTARKDTTEIPGATTPPIVDQAIQTINGAITVNASAVVRRARLETTRHLRSTDLSTHN